MLSNDYMQRLITRCRLSKDITSIWKLVPQKSMQQLCSLVQLQQLANHLCVSHSGLTCMEIMWVHSTFIMDSQVRFSDYETFRFGVFEKWHR